MVPLFPNPLSGDIVDRYNHKWMVLLMLVLTLISWIIPMHPSYQVEAPPQTPQPPPHRRTIDHPRVTAHCWVPSQFTDAHVQYVESHCSNAFNAALGEDNETSVYRVLEDPGIPVDRHRAPFTAPRKEYFEMKHQEDKGDEKREDLKGRVQKLVTFQAPIMLLLAAILLTIPHVIWSFLSACFGSFNVEQTLESASHASRCLDATNRQQVYVDLYLSVAQVAHLCPRTSSILYLTKKVLAVVVALVVLLIVSQHGLSELEEVTNDLSSITLPLAVKVSSGDDPMPTHVQHSTDWLKHPNDVFLCDFKIRQFAKFQHFTVQCAVADIEQNDKTETASTNPIPRSWSNERNLVEFESLLFSIVTAVLVILTVGNVASLCAWVCKLCISSSRSFVGLPINSPMDIVFLVQMARVNTSFDVARRLAQTSSAKDEGEMMSLTEPQSSKS